jgi:membrane protease YdiL (CAAX protease family)
MSEQLPPIHPLLVRSTYAMALVAITTVAAAFDFDLLARLGTTDAKILAAIDAMLPLASAAWLWIERRNPQYRITLKKD